MSPATIGGGDLVPMTGHGIYAALALAPMKENA